MKELFSYHFPDVNPFPTESRAASYKLFNNPLTDSINSGIFSTDLAYTSKFVFDFCYSDSDSSTV